MSTTKAARTAGPRVVDNDRDEITVTLDGKEIRGWSYADEQERRVKMLCAREFVEGWYQAPSEPNLNRDLLYSYRAILKAVGPVRQALQIICDDIEDEGDRAYFGSTNHADRLKEIAQGLEDAEWSEVVEPLPKVLELDSWKLVNAACELRIKNAAVQRQNDEMLAALKDFADEFLGEDGLDRAMNYGLDAILVGARAAISKATGQGGAA